MSDEAEQIRERFRRLREDPMTPQYLTAPGQSGSLLDYQEAQELGDLACRDGHKGLGRVRDGYQFCSRCGHRVCPICGKDVGSLWAAWLDHKGEHA